MRALRLRTSESHGSRLCLEENWPRPRISDGEAVVRVTLTGVCSTDLELVKGYMQFEGILGHEFVGVVEQSADPTWLGRRVVSSINIASVDSPGFAEFGRQHAPHRKVLGILGRDGAMAEYVKVPCDNLHPVPEGVVDRAAVFTEPLAAALRIAQQIVIDPAARIAVLGPGRLGMLIGLVLSRGGAQVVMLGRNSNSLKLAQKWRLDGELVADQADSCFDVVVDATGQAEGLSEAIRLTKPLGKIVLKSTFQQAQPLNMTKVVVDEIEILGSRCGPFAPALRLLEADAIPVEELIDAEFALSDAIAAMQHASQRGVRKVLIRMDGRSQTRA